MHPVVAEMDHVCRSGIRRAYSFHNDCVNNKLAFQN